MIMHRFGESRTRAIAVLSSLLIGVFAFFAVSVAVPTEYMPLAQAAEEGAVAVPAKQVKGNDAGLYCIGEIDGAMKPPKKRAFTIADITGDGKRDKVTMSLTGFKDKGYFCCFSGIKFTVNGKAYGTIKLNKKTDYAWVCFIIMKNGDAYVYLRMASGDGHSVGGTLYQSKNGKFKKVLSADTLKKAGALWANSITPKGNVLTVEYSIESKYLGAMSLSMKYKSKNGKLVQVSAKPTSWGYFAEESKLGHYASPAAKAFKVYTDTNLKKVAFTVAKDQKVKAVAAKLIKGKLYLKIKSGGKSGWVKDGPLKGYPIFENCHEYTFE